MVDNRERPVTRNRIDSAMINQFELFQSKLTEVTEMDKRRLGIEGGVKVTAQLSGKLAQRTNMCSGFIIYSINDEPIHNMRDFTSAVADKEGVMLTGVYPDGRRDRYYLELV